MEVNVDVSTAGLAGAKTEIAIARVIGNRLDAAAIHLQNRVKENLSVPGTKRYTPGMTRTRMVSFSMFTMGTRQATVRGRFVQTPTVYSRGMQRSGGRRLRAYRTGQRVYNAEHSKVGEYPRKQTGHLRRSITHVTDRTNLVARVGTNVKYGRVLELGLPPMTGPRPFMRMTTDNEMANLQTIVQHGQMAWI